MSELDFVSFFKTKRGLTKVFPNAEKRTNWFLYTVLAVVAFDLHILPAFDHAAYTDGDGQMMWAGFLPCLAVMGMFQLQNGHVCCSWLRKLLSLLHILLVSSPVSETNYVCD